MPLATYRKRVTRVYDATGNVIEETHEHAGEFKEW